MTTARLLLFKARARRALLALLVVAAVGGVFWYRRLSEEGAEQAPSALPENPTKAEMVTRDFRHVETRLDRTIWVLEAAQAEVADEYAKLSTVKITWHGETGRLPVVITSDKGDVDFRKRKAILYGSVRVERADGAVLMTEQLLWDEQNKHLRAPKDVVITTPNFTFQGERLDANLEAEHFVLHGHVRGDVRGGAIAPSRPS